MTKMTKDPETHNVTKPREDIINSALKKKKMLGKLKENKASKGNKQDVLGTDTWEREAV